MILWVLECMNLRVHVQLFECLFVIMHDRVCAFVGKCVSENFNVGEVILRLLKPKRIFRYRDTYK